jgi:hypothetical protein
MAAQNHSDLAEEYGIPRWSTGFWGARLSGVLGGLLMDLLAEGAATALDGAWAHLFTPASNPYDKPSDAIGVMGRDSLLPLVTGEDPHTSLLPRLQDKWGFWTGSPEDGLESVFALAGTGPVDVLVPGDFAVAPDAFDHWSRFWIRFPEGSHVITGSADTYADGSLYGDGSTYGPAGLTAETFQLIKSLASRYKPAQWVAWDVEFILSGVTYRSMVFPRIDTAFVPEA